MFRSNIEAKDLLHCVGSQVINQLGLEATPNLGGNVYKPEKPMLAKAEID